MSNQILTTQFNELLEKSYNNYPSRFDEKKPSKQDFAKGPGWDGYSENESFETDSFDIFNPGNSIETFSSFDLEQLDNREEEAKANFNDDSLKQSLENLSINSKKPGYAYNDDANLSQQSDQNDL